MSTPACCSTETLLGEKTCDFLCAHRFKSSSPKEGNKCPLFSQPGLCKDRWPPDDFYFFSRFFFFFPIAFVCSTNCDSRLPWEQLFPALLGAEEEGQGWGLFARRGQAGVSLYNPINAGTGSNRVHVPTESTKWPQAVTLEGPCKHLWGKKKKKKDRFLMVNVLPHHVWEAALLLGSKAHKKLKILVCLGVGRGLRKVLYLR